MNLRQKLLLLFSITVAAAVTAVAWTVLVRIRIVFEQRDREETALFVSQFQREFQHRSADVAAAIERIAASDHVRAMAFELVQSGDASPYLTEAQALAEDAQVDFLEIVGPDGNVVSSAQWPARFGYPEPAASQSSATFLKQEALPDNSTALGIFAVRPVHGADPAVRLIGGKRLDQAFLADLPVAPGMQTSLYTNANRGELAAAQTAFDPTRLVSASGQVSNAAAYQSLIESALKSGQQTNEILYPTARREDSLSVTAIPLKNESGNVQAVLIVSIARAGMAQAEQHIRAIAYGVAAVGILLAIFCSLWIAARVSRPIERLARAAEDVAAGKWETRVPVRGRDEVAVLGRSFNHMTAELSAQRDRLIQTERVAAWRELARRLAHELKNPLFPLQLTVENLMRARDLSAEEFDEVFRESTRTLSMEISNLKTIIGRFSDFSKMPRPELERMDAKDIIDRVQSLYEQAGASTTEKPEPIRFHAELSAAPMALDVDPELMHRALSNLVLNAMDAMPNGGILTLAARPQADKIEIRISDTGAGMTPEECERLFTPYYTTKEHGTGLGLAIVQSVIADHAGTIAVECEPGSGATFVITLPRASETHL